MVLENRRADDVKQCDLLVADYAVPMLARRLLVLQILRTLMLSFEGEGRRLFAIVLLPRKQAFIHDATVYCK